MRNAAAAAWRFPASLLADLPVPAAQPAAVAASGGGQWVPAPPGRGVLDRALGPLRAAADVTGPRPGPAAGVAAAPARERCLPGPVLRGRQ